MTISIVSSRPHVTDLFSVNMYVNVVVFPSFMFLVSRAASFLSAMCQHPLGSLHLVCRRRRPPGGASVCVVVGEKNVKVQRMDCRVCGRATTRCIDPYAASHRRHRRRLLRPTTASGRWPPPVAPLPWLAHTGQWPPAIWRAAAVHSGSK